MPTISASNRSAPSTSGPTDSTAARFDLADPWGNQYELNCYDYDTVTTELVEPDNIEPDRYWLQDLYDAHRPP